MMVFPGTHRQGAIAHNLDDPLKPYVEARHYAGVAGVVLDLPAGNGVLINPLLLHASVPNRSRRTKFTLMVQVQDYAAVIDPDNETDDLALFERIANSRTRARAQAAG